MLIMHIGFFGARHISQTQSFQQNRHIIFHALVALNLLVSLISHLVASLASHPYFSSCASAGEREGLVRCARVSFQSGM